MLVRSGWFCVILCLELFLGLEAEVTITNKAYQNVVVSFSRGISADNATHSIRSMQQLLSETSSVLQKAIGFRIGSVIFHIPQTWDASSLEGVSAASASDLGGLPDIRVESVSDSAFGNHPVAIQFSDCGVPGFGITIPRDFLDAEENYPKGKTLAREWLKYRYGVFDENGFQNDPLYPSHYAIAGSDDIHVTDCTFPGVNYHFRDSNDTNCSLPTDGSPVADCFIHPTEESKETVSSSLMFYHKELPSVDHICGAEEDHLHNPNSPNKHNLLCKYKSILEVIKMSDDFIKESTHQQSDGNEGIQYSYVQDSPLRLTVAWQNTKSLQDQGQLILHAVRKLMYDIPLHTKIGLCSFKEEPTEERGLRELTSDAEREVALIANFMKPVDPCITCAVNKMVDDLITDKADEAGTIVVIAAANPTENKELVKKLKNYKLCVVVIAFPGASREGWAKLTEVSECSSFTEIPSNVENEVKFVKLYDVLESILPLPVDDIRVKTVTTGWLSTSNSITIANDSTAATFTVWIFGTIESDDFQCRVGDELLELTPGVKTQNLVSFSFVPQAEEVKCNLQYSPASHLAQIQMTSMQGAYFQNDAWIRDTTPDGGKEQMPIIIYARINYGSYPVINAEVKAVVTGPTGHKTETLLLDNGRGYPDITGNDGIYSRYFTEFQSDGDYTIHITANHNGNQAKFGRNGQEPCCGSVVLSETLEESPPFQWVFEMNFHAISKKPEQGYTPSRIVDLKVDQLSLPDSITLKWTAPGGEMDQGKAQTYILKSFVSREDALLRYNDSSIEINMTFTPQAMGESESFEISLDEFDDNATYFFALKSISPAGETSEPSNIVTFFIPEGKVVTKDDITTEQPLDKHQESGMDPKILGLIIGLAVLVIIIIICICIAVYIVYVKPKRKKERQDHHRSNNAPSVRSSPFGVNSIPADVILKHHNEVVSAKNTHKDPPIFKEENIETMQGQSSNSDNVSQNNNSDYTLPDRRAMATFNSEQPPKSPKRMTVV